jgi:hypothetical protein
LIVLALDTTTRGGSVAVTDDDRMRALLPGDESRTHGERLPGDRPCVWSLGSEK